MDPDKKLKKETRKLHIYESELLHQYKEFLLGLEKILDQFSKNSNNELLQQVAAIALRCMGELLVRHSHFNYTSNIIQAIVPYLNDKNGELRSLAVKYVTQILKTDKQGHLSLEVVQKIDKLVRKSAFRVHSDAFKVLISLRIKHIQNMDENAVIINNSKQKKSRNEKMIAKLAANHNSKPSRQQAKEKRKMAKLTAEINMVMADKDKANKNKQESVVIQVVFGLYIHVLKRRPNRKLIGVVLEGLAKFAHLVNIEFFSDLLDVLALLLDGGEELGFTLTHCESLYCIQTVITILSGQGEVLNLDIHRFCVYLYSKLFEVSASKNHETIVPSLETCCKLLLQRRKTISPAIVNAFAKRLGTLALNLLHNGSIPTLSTIRQLFLAHTSTEALLDPAPEGTSGTFNPDASDPLHSNSSASALWELHLLSRHYHPNVKQLSSHLLQGAPVQGQGSIPYSLSKLTNEELYHEYDSSEMKLNPPLLHPDAYFKTKKRNRK